MLYRTHLLKQSRFQKNRSVFLDRRVHTLDTIIYIYVYCQFQKKIVPGPCGQYFITSSNVCTPTMLEVTRRDTFQHCVM
ncbi:hypothetical protein FGO68_gene12309 [Halteria grandinella]|uniref:Uncharacterized protein n=1 Tax=Halteria grandinella TaxID=5974 RepID=A0A8J8N9L1_HALGN|nr:hypothetical protein FGO68_gene12309 [Halteria grandinella]